MSIRVFTNMDDFLETLAADQKAADEAAKTHHLKVEDFHHGDYFIRFVELYGRACRIFGEVIEHVEVGRHYNAEDAAAVAEDIRESRARGYVFAKCYSEVCVKGELGDTHISTIDRKVSKATFDRAKANGWRHMDPTN